MLKKERVVMWADEIDLTGINQISLDKKNVETLIPKLLKYPCKLEKSPVFGTLLVFENADTDDNVQNVLDLIENGNYLNIFINKKPNGLGGIGFYLPKKPDHSPHTLDGALTDIIAGINELYDTDFKSPLKVKKISSALTPHYHKQRNSASKSDIKLSENKDAVFKSLDI